jgi:6-phosphogluconolactonase/glucosamine-6-phosphate isomerase/deaminase
MRLIIQPNYELVSKWAANYVARTIKDFKPTENNPFILGLPTGSSPIGMYKEIMWSHLIWTNMLTCRKITQRVIIHLCGIIFSTT